MRPWTNSRRLHCCLAMSQSGLMQLRVCQTAVLTVGNPFWTARIAHPNDRELNTLLRKSTMELNDSLRPANTAKQFDNELLEHFDFCDKVHPHDQRRHTLASDKMHWFMWCQCFANCGRTLHGSEGCAPQGCCTLLHWTTGVLFVFPCPLHARVRRRCPRGLDQQQEMV